jgi:hypothetical protein
MIRTGNNEFAIKCFELACNVIGFLENDLLRQDVCIRYNRTAGAYVSIDPNNDDRIILRNAEMPPLKDRGGLSFFLQSKLHAVSFFPTEEIKQF